MNRKGAVLKITIMNAAGPSSCCGAKRPAVARIDLDVSNGEVVITEVRHLCYQCLAVWLCRLETATHFIGKGESVPNVTLLDVSGDT